MIFRLWKRLRDELKGIEIDMRDPEDVEYFGQKNLASRRNVFN